MSDLIDRQAVLTSIKNLYPDMPIVDIFGARRKWLEKYTPYFDCENAVKQLPSAENKGEWIAQDIHNCHTNFKCSKCGYIHSFMHLYGEPTADYTYCPNCGADMRKIRCNTCKNNDDELSGECYECVKGIFDHYETEVENGRTND